MPFSRWHVGIAVFGLAAIMPLAAGLFR